ncbi:MMPL family transporter [Nocardioides caeni]|uniref:MMPL family transporter n=1 Tax=Nocardioides caeni TaxID=574700 RepID=A0A4S8N0D6_9ACTN|nr:MMPL family transporter [Nocardioides caeni]THV08911.1 MMPL family transporter [Nocardioides caeni]
MTDTPRRSPVSLITGRRTAWLVALLPLLLALAIIGFAGEGEREPLATDSQPRGLDSTLGTELAERLPESDATTAIVVYEAAGDDPLDPAALEQAARALGAVPAGAPSDGSGGPSYLLAAEDQTAAVAVVPLEGGTSTEVADQVADLRDRARADLHEDVDALVTGPAAIEADLAEVFSGANLKLLGATAGVVAILLILTYRSPVLFLVPLVVVGVADRLAAVGATHLLAALDSSIEIAWNESTIGILSVLVFGAGTDYALLLISRYRDELRRRESRHEAMAVAVRRTTEAVLASSVTVVVGVLTLALSLTPTTRGLGVACALGVVIAATFALVVLPAALVLFGRWVFWPRVPRPDGAVGGAVRADDAAGPRTIWHRVGDAVAGRPLVFAVGTVMVLVALAANVLSLQTGLDVEDQFLDRPEAIDGAARIGESFPAGVASPTTVVTAADPDDVLDLVEGVPGVASARVATEGDGVAELSVVLDVEPGSDGARGAVKDLRAALDDVDDTHVTGQEAEALDEDEGAARDRMLILPLILGLVLVALGVLLRSVVAPVLLVATVVATYAASLGASWWIFTTIFDFGALDSGAPLMAFLFLVALGVDYNIFLLSRTLEELPGHGTRAGILRALAATGGVITSAGIVLAAVFLVLGVLPLVVLAQLGVIVCIGVLLDTLVVRTVLVPALVLLLGDRFWWPRRVPVRQP